MGTYPLPRFRGVSEGFEYPFGPPHRSNFRPNFFPNVKTQFRCFCQGSIGRQKNSFPPTIRVASDQTACGRSPNLMPPPASPARHAPAPTGPPLPGKNKPGFPCRPCFPDGKKKNQSYSGLYCPSSAHALPIVTTGTTGAGEIRLPPLKAFCPARWAAVVPNPPARPLWGMSRFFSRGQFAGFLEIVASRFCFFGVKTASEKAFFGFLCPRSAGPVNE